MRAVVLVPYRGDGGARTRNWVYVRKWLWQMGWPLMVGDTTPEDHRIPFERAAARNIAAKMAGEWDVALFCDADTVPERHIQAITAVQNAYDTGEYTAAHSRLCYLSETGTQQVTSGERELAEAEQRDRPIGLTWECCFAVRRDYFEKVDGFDERFVGYGGQVAAFYYAYSTYAGRARVPGDIYHLDHPLTDRDTDPNFKANCNLAERYRQAVDNHVLMDMMLEERRSP
jgi:hypothetical protein